MKNYYYSFVLLLILLCSSCALAPEKKVSMYELTKTKPIIYYIMEDDPEGVLKILNNRGEVVVKAGYFDKPVYLKIFATSDGLEVMHFNRDEYDFER